MEITHMLQMHCIVLTPVFWLRELMLNSEYTCKCCRNNLWGIVYMDKIIKMPCVYAQPAYYVICLLSDVLLKFMWNAFIKS